MSSASANILLVKTAIVIVVFCLAECAAGSCLQYGHSCWGAHGKRNGGGAGGGTSGGLIRIRGDDPGVGRLANTRWYLSRLVQAPADLRLWQDERDRHIMVTRNSQDRHIQNDSETDSDNGKRLEDPEDSPAMDINPDESDSDEVVLMEEPTTSLGQKLRLYKLMQKNVAKLN